MSLEHYLAARYHRCEMSPMARLTLLTLADALTYGDGAPCTHIGPRELDRLADTTQQPLAAVVDALAELEDNETLFRDDSPRLALLQVDPAVTRTPNTWLSFVPEWEDSWVALVMAAHPIARQPIPPALRRAVMERDHSTCQHCGSTDRLSVDHIVPVVWGGLAVLANLQVLCRRCNSVKADRRAVSA